MSDLPWMGLGLSTNLGPRDRPDPWRLVETHPGLFDYVEYSAPLDLDEARQQAPRFAELLARRDTLPALYHPVHLNLYGPELEPPARLAAMARHVEAVGSPWVGNDVGWWHHRGEPFPGYLYIPPRLDDAGLEDAVTHALAVQAALPVPLLLENPATIASGGPMHVLEFMARLHERTGLGLILDLGHLMSHQLAGGLPLDAGLERFPFERVVELHLAGGVVTRRGARGFYADDHTQPVREELFGLLDAVLPRCTHLRAVTFEGDGHPDALAALTLRRLRERVRPREERSMPGAAAGASRTTVPGTAAAPNQVRLQSDPWRRFDEVHGRCEPREDPEGARAELDYRLAVLAEALDRDFPVSRLLVAGTRERLAALAASAEYRDLFERGGGLGQAYGAFARRMLRERPEPGGEAALAFELWAHGQLQRPMVAPAAGRTGLAPGVRLAVFPFDLSELVHATESLRRHLTGRAWASGQLEPSGLEGLVQAARRPAPGPWRIALHRAGGRLRVVSLDAPLFEVVRAAASGPPWDELAGRADRRALERALAGGLIALG